jgi:hypothetical protein
MPRVRLHVSALCIKNFHVRVLSGSTPNNQGLYSKGVVVVESTISVYLPYPALIAFPSHVVSVVVDRDGEHDAKDTADAHAGFRISALPCPNQSPQAHKNPTPKTTPKANLCFWGIRTFQNNIMGIPHARQSCTTLTLAAAIRFAASLMH